MEIDSTEILSLLSAVVTALSGAVVVLWRSTEKSRNECEAQHALCQAELVKILTILSKIKEHIEI